MRRYAKHFSQVGLNRKRKLEEIQGPPELKMFDFIQGLKRPNPQDMLQQHQAMMRANLRAIVQSQQQVYIVMANPGRVLKKRVSGFDFQKPGYPGRVSGFQKCI